MLVASRAPATQDRPIGSIVHERWDGLGGIGGADLDLAASPDGTMAGKDADPGSRFVITSPA